MHTVSYISSKGEVAAECFIFKQYYFNERSLVSQIFFFYIKNRTDKQLNEAWKNPFCVYTVSLSTEQQCLFHPYPKHTVESSIENNLS